MKRIHEGEFCLECGAIATDTHHCLFGSNREKAEYYGLTVRLCRRCHSKLHDEDERLALKYRRLGQLAFEYKFNHEDYMRIFGRNYL